MLNSTALRRQCKSAARLEIQRGGLWKCIGAIALMAIPETLLSVAVNIKMNPAMELLNQMALDETVDLSQYMEQMVTVYAYLGIFVLVSLLILSPLQFGALHFCMARAHGQQGEMGDVVIGFSRLKKYLTAIKTDLCIVLFTLLWGVPLIGGATALSIALAELVFRTTQSLNAFMGMMLLAVVLIIAAAIVVSARVMRYSAAYILLIEDENMGSWRAVRESTRLFRKRTWELFVFQMSFLGWELLSEMTMGLFGLYVFPYNNIAFIHYVDALRAPEGVECIEPSIPA